jgi:hypothetical protein
VHYVLWTPGRPVAQRIENYVHSLLFKAGRAVKGEWFNVDLASAQLTIDWASRQLYTSQRNCDYIDSRRDWAGKLAELAAQLSTNVEKLGGRVVSIGKNGNWHVDGTANIFLRIARWIPGEKDHYSARWSMQRRGLVAGWIVAIRLGDNNTSILDYLLAPAACTDRDAIRFSEKDRARLGMTRFETSEALVRSLSLRLTTKHGRVSQPKQARPSKQSRPNPPIEIHCRRARH